MANMHYSDNVPSGRAGKQGMVKQGKAKTGGTVTEKTAAWPGLPGKSQSRDRSAGVKKLKVNAKSEGL